MGDGGEREAFVTADYNAEMIEHIARFPRIRDGAVFVGNPDDVVPDSFGADLPRIRDWTEQHYDFAGYVTGFEPVTDREKLRAELGYGPREQVCVVTVGGSGVGGHLLRRRHRRLPRGEEARAELRMVVFAGRGSSRRRCRRWPAGDPRHVHELYRHLAACDLAVVQGGLDFERDGPEEIATAIAEEIGREVDYRPVETDGAARAAKLIAELI
jgi:hypothetical protein